MIKPQVNADARGSEVGNISTKIVDIGCASRVEKASLQYLFAQLEKYPMKKTTNLLLGSAITLLIALATVVGLPTLTPKNTNQDIKYRVFCANGKLEVEQRTLEQEKNARGSSVCMLAEFDSRSDADNYAENHGGKGSECKCN
jgi:hypothetical protein